VACLDIVDLIEHRLAADPVPNLMALKFLRMFPRDSQYGLETSGGAWASVFGFAPELFYFDRDHYAGQAAVWYLNANDRPCLDRLWADRDLAGQVLKASSEPAIAWCAARLRPVRRFFWYSAPHTVTSWPGVAFSPVYDERIDEILVSNRVAEDYRARMRASGHDYLFIEEDGRIVSFCYLQTVWPGIREISGVFTRPECRGRGLGRRVVAAAQNRLAEQGLMSRYYVEETNVASIALAHSVGLTPLLESIHFMA
jgi:GNAT superfamily N-acetyltransferase